MKLPRWALLVLLALAVTFLSGCTSPPDQKSATASPGSRDAAPTGKVPIVRAGASLPSESDVKCEICHENPETIPKMAKGGKICSLCHGAQVHSIHEKRIQQNKTTCATCHGFPPTVPKADPGGTVCEKCMGFPDPLSPSNGNLVNIHIPRGVYCTRCHTERISQIHSRARGAGAASPSPAPGTVTLSLDAEEGKKLFSAKGCSACHRLFGEGGVLGPDLTGVKERRTADWLQAWLKDPAAVNPKTTMPNLGLTDDEVKGLVAYLREGT